MRIVSKISRFTVGSLFVAGLLCVSSARAAFTDNFDELLVELQARSAALSNSTDKAEIKQKKACDKAIKAIVKEGKNLAADIKTAAKVAKTLEKAFTNEFGVVTFVATTNLETLVQSLFDDLKADVTEALAEVQTAIDALPEGTAKTQAQEALDAATALLAQSAISFADAAKLLSSALKDVIKAEKIVEKASGGGGGGGSGISATVNIGGNNINWSAEGGAEWVQSTGILDIGGATNNLQVSAAQCSGFNGTTGNFPLGGSCGGVFDFGGMVFYGVVSGTLHIATFNAATHSLSGTFSYTASDGSNTVTVSNGQFNLTNLTVTP